ncbi:MAG: NADH:flavin oxidoreductase, partial [Pseudomonadota bacterium]|nr:NADH:flavin oxidoreductase [Pseudomonadota bacterium]
YEVVDGIRESCGDNFLLGVRLSPERFGIKLNESKEVCQKLIDKYKIDFLDISLWDSFKHPIEEEHKNKTLLEHFTELNYGDVQLTVAGNIRTSKNVYDILDSKVNFVAIGRAAILNHDFPNKVMENIEFEPIDLPASRNYLKGEGLSEKFIDYLKFFKGFVEE